MLNFDIDPENGGGSLTVGKYVADGLFVSATQDAQGKGGSVIIEYEITDNVSVETEVRQDGDQTVSANWKKDL
jgi:autotransporter translocation and assembly factor TamB